MISVVMAIMVVMTAMKAVLVEMVVGVFYCCCSCWCPSQMKNCHHEVDRYLEFSRNITADETEGALVVHRIEQHREWIDSIAFRGNSEESLSQFLNGAI